VPGQRLAEQARRVLAGCAGHGAIEVTPRCIAVGGVRAAFDHLLGTPARGQTAKVGDALFCDDDVYVVLGVVDVAAHGAMTRWHRLSQHRG